LLINRYISESKTLIMAYNHFPIENQVTHDCREEIKKEKKYIKFLKDKGYEISKVFKRQLF